MFSLRIFRDFSGPCSLIGGLRGEEGILLDLEFSTLIARANTHSQFEDMLLAKN